MAARRTLTRKQKAFTQEYIANGGNGTQAALASYDTTDPSVAAPLASENLTKPKIRAEIQRALDEQDISINDGLLVIKDALVAEARTKGGRRVPLWAPRLVAAREVLRLCHAYEGTGETGAKQSYSQHLHVKLSGEVSADVLSWLAGWYRQYKARPGRQQFLEVFGRDPKPAERALLEADQDHKG